MTAPLPFSLSVARQIRDYETPLPRRRIPTAPLVDPNSGTGASASAQSGVSP